MATLTLIAEPFPDWEAPVQAATVRDLAAAVAETAPRSCAARVLIARGTEAPPFESPRIRVEQLPMKAAMLPVMWQSRTTARPLDGEFVHAVTPMIPLRARGEDDGSQSSVTITHSIAWDAPALLGASAARLYRAYVRRAAKLADALLTPTHATAAAIQRHFKYELPFQVLPLAVPAEFRPRSDAAERRALLGLPEQYAVTTARPGEHSRLEWVFDALRADPSLPPVVVIDGLDPEASPLHAKTEDPAAPAAAEWIPEDLRHRVVPLRPSELSDVGAVLSGAMLLLQPQSFSDSGYVLLGALAAGVPVLHAGLPATAEIALEAGVAADDAAEFAAHFSSIFRDTDALSRLSVLACDRGRGFQWRSTAWQLWETHANL